MSIRFWWRCTLFLIYPSGKLCSQCPRNIVGSLKPKCLRKGETTNVSLEEEAPEICPQLVPSFAKKILRAPSLSCVQAENFHSKVFGELVAQDAVRATQRKGNSHCKHLNTCAPTCRHYDGNCICKRDCILDTAKHEWATHITVLHQFQQSASVFTSAGLLLFTKLFLIIHKALDIIIHNAIIIIH